MYKVNCTNTIRHPLFLSCPLTIKTLGRSQVISFWGHLAYSIVILCLTLNICDALSDLVPFVQIKNREKQPWKSVAFSKVTLLCGCFSGF